MTPRFAWWFGVLVAPLVAWDRWPRASAAVLGAGAVMVVWMVWAWGMGR